jgi:hypothetical protein
MSAPTSVFGATMVSVLRQFAGILMPIADGSGSSFGHLQRDLAAVAGSLLTLQNPLARNVMRSGLELMLDSAGVLQEVTTEDGGPIWREFQNKVQAFYAFEHVDSILGTGSDHSFSLPDLLRRVALLDPWCAVWAVEGLGHGYTGRKSYQTRPAGLFKNSEVHLPAWSIVPLHTGMGLALAQSILSGADDCKVGADRFLESCQRNSQEDCWEAAYEALGLVVFNLYPHWLLPLHHYLSQQQELLSYFWHGVGRAIYFTPLNLPPWRSAPWAGLVMCMSETPTALARRNALAGFSWAMTLVNIRHPQILGLFLRHHAAGLAAPDAFINGVYSSAVVWQHSIPRADANLEALCHYQPGPSDGFLPGVWENLIGQPCKQALNDCQALLSLKHVAGLFRL